MTDIFISYASDDRQKVETLAKELEEQGWSVFWDRRILAGKTFSQVIEEAIAAAKCVVVLWSNASIKSDWVQNEAAEGAKKRILVPALIEDVEIPFEFRRIQEADLTDWIATESNSPGFAVLLDSISEIVRPSPGKDKTEMVPKESELNLKQQIEVIPEVKETHKRTPRITESTEKKLKITSPNKAPGKKGLCFGIVAIALMVIIGGISFYRYVGHQKKTSPIPEKERGLRFGQSTEKPEEEIPTTKMSEINDFGDSKHTSASTSEQVNKEGSSNEDYYQFKTPPTYRDIIQIRIENRSKKFEPSLTVLDANKIVIGSSQPTFSPGANLEYSFIANPDSTYYVHVKSHRKGTIGNYKLKISALKAYDQYEPNDSILKPKFIDFGKSIEAEILDKKDQDYYKFKIPSISSKVIVIIENRSATLEPRLSVFDADKNNISGWQRASNPGANLKYSFKANPDSIYYVYVTALGYYGGGGKYSLTVKEK